MIDSKAKKYIPIFFIPILFILINNCDGFVFFEYLKIKLLVDGGFQNHAVTVQFVNDTFQKNYCYFTLSESYFDPYESSHTFYTYLPRTPRIIINQIFLLFFTSLFIVKKIKTLKQIKEEGKVFWFTLVLGLLINLNVITFMKPNVYGSISDYFDGTLLFYTFVFLSISKCFLAFLYIKNNKYHFSLFALLMFPFISSGYGVPWFFDFVIYYLIFILLDKYQSVIANKYLLLIFSSLFLSLLYPIVATPSLETQFINNTIETKLNAEDINQRNTYLEYKDVDELEKLYRSNDNQDFKQLVVDSSRNIKEITYPHRWKFMVAFLPDFKFHLPSFIWYISVIIILFQLTSQLKDITRKEFKYQLSKFSSILIYYQLLSLFLGINVFINSISSFLFSLSQRPELIYFGEIQTWRGINDHYEIFSNLQLLCFCLYILNYYLNRSLKNFTFPFIALLTTLLSQSRWTTLIIFILLIFISINFFSEFKKEVLLIVLFSLLAIQFIPTFEREEPFFVTNSSEVQSIEGQVVDEVSLFGFEIISDRLNRTLPWKMFVSGYKPDNISLLFGHGTGAYLNIVKNTKADVASGPHSLILQVLNRFGVYGLLLLSYLMFVYIKFITKNLEVKSKIFISITILLLFSIEIKTDSIMLVDGSMIYAFNLLLGFVYKKLVEIKVYDKE